MSSLLTYAEKLVLFRDYGPGGWHAWRIFSLDRNALPVFRRLPRLTAAAYGARGIAAISSVGILSVLVMWSCPVRSPGFLVGVAFTFLASLLLNVRDVYGGDGSQQMNTLVGAAVLLGFNPWTSTGAESIALLFIAAQSCLAYSTSGIAKLVSRVWMRGDALTRIFSTKSYGSEMVFRLLSGSPVLSRVIGRGTVAIEVLFPLALIGPKWVLLAALCWGVVFHVLNALFMGLNTFFWSFGATYPALYYVWIVVHR